VTEEDTGLRLRSSIKLIQYVYVQSVIFKANKFKREHDEVLKLWDAICDEVERCFGVYLLHEEVKILMMGDYPDIIFTCEERAVRHVRPACRALKIALMEASKNYAGETYIQDGRTTFIGIDEYFAEDFVRLLEDGFISLEIRDME